MKILYHHRIRSKDGQYVHLYEMVHALREQGHEVEIVGPRHVEAAAFGADAGLVSWLKRWIPGALYELLELSYAIGDYLRTTLAIQRFRPDVIYERYNLYFPSGVWAARHHGVPLILEVNAPLYDERLRFGGLSLHRLARWSERTVWCGADFVLPVTEVLAARIAAVGVPRARMQVLHNGISRSDFAKLPSRDHAKAMLGLTGRTVLGFVGFVRDWHGLDRVLRYVSDHREMPTHILLVGDGPDRDRLERLAQNLDLADRLTVTGVVDRHDVPRHVAAFDIALQPAVVPYASPLKLFEYMAVGLPVLAPDSANIREILTHNVNALLFRDGDDVSFMSNLSRLCRDSQLRQALGLSAQQALTDLRLTWSENAMRVGEIGARLCEAAR